MLIRDLPFKHLPEDYPETLVKHLELHIDAVRRGFEEPVASTLTMLLKSLSDTKVSFSELTQEQTEEILSELKAHHLAGQTYWKEVETIDAVTYEACLKQFKKFRQNLTPEQFDLVRKYFGGFERNIEQALKQGDFRRIYPSPEDMLQMFSFNDIAFLEKESIDLVLEVLRDPRLQVTADELKELRLLLEQFSESFRILIHTSAREKKTDRARYLNIRKQLAASDIPKQEILLEQGPIHVRYFIQEDHPVSAQGLRSALQDMTNMLGLKPQELEYIIGDSAIISLHNPRALSRGFCAGEDGSIFILTNNKNPNRIRNLLYHELVHKLDRELGIRRHPKLDKALSTGIAATKYASRFAGRARKFDTVNDQGDHDFFLIESTSTLSRSQKSSLIGENLAEYLAKVCAPNWTLNGQNAYQKGRYTPAHQEKIEVIREVLQEKIASMRSKRDFWHTDTLKERI